MPFAKAANECLTFKGIHAAFIVGKTGNRDIRISARSDGTINVQIIAEKLGGGGHLAVLLSLLIVLRLPKQLCSMS